MKHLVNSKSRVFIVKSENTSRFFESLNKTIPTEKDLELWKKISDLSNKKVDEKK